MTRAEAAQAGALLFTTKPCKRDGDTRRYTKSAHCVTCSQRRSKAQAAKIRKLINEAKGE